jgi:hypothetical protein
MRRCAGILVLCTLLSSTRPAKADGIENAAIGAAVGIAAAAAAITVGIVLIVTHKPSITGCTAEGPKGLTLQSESDKTLYVLHGDIASIKPGERVKVSGKHQKKSSTDFDVVKLKKSYGACSAVANGA